MALVSAFLEILQRPSVGKVAVELMIFIAPLWIAVFVGVLVGWAWKPRWANFDNTTTNNSSISSKTSSSSCSSSSSPPAAAAAADIVSNSFASIPSFSSLKSQLPTCFLPFLDVGSDQKDAAVAPDPDQNTSVSKLGNEKGNFVGEDDLQHLSKIVEEKDGGPAWIQMMDRSTSNMSYQAWRRDPETGPPQYRSRTVYEDTSPDLMRDFFWDDEFRLKWDDMLLEAETLEECSATGTMVVKWVRKFPFFCSDREYIIGRRIWESGRTYYCVTKGVPYPSVPRRDKPRRVDLYYSSWTIRAVESKKGDGQLSACEVLLFHHEDMGIPWEIAKLGVRQGMWGAVKKIDRGLRSYQRYKATGPPLSHCAFMAQINSKVTTDYLRYLQDSQTVATGAAGEESSSACADEKPSGRNIPKILVVGGAIALACTLDRGLLTKAVIFGVARRFAKIGRRL